MTAEVSITTVVHVIQLAVAPVFLLSGGLLIRLREIYIASGSIHRVGNRE